MRRVVVTGLGLVSPLGWGVEPSWRAMLAGKSGAGRISAFDPTDYACQVACEVPRTDGRGAKDFETRAFDPEQVMSARERRRIDDFILYAIAAADEAVKDSGWDPQTDEERERTGVMIGSGIGGLGAIAETSIELHEKGPRRVSPFFIPSALINLASGHYLKLGIALQLVEGAPEEVDGSKALDAAIDLFSGLPVEEVATAKERRALKEELATTLEEAYDEEVMGVYFTEFVTQ